MSPRGGQYTRGQVSSQELIFSGAIASRVLCRTIAKPSASSSVGKKLAEVSKSKYSGISVPGKTDVQLKGLIINSNLRCVQAFSSTMVCWEHREAYFGKLLVTPKMHICKWCRWCRQWSTVLWKKLFSDEPSLTLFLSVNGAHLNKPTGLFPTVKGSDSPFMVQ